jgi:hypothetical protein
MTGAVDLFADTSPLKHRVQKKLETPRANGPIDVVSFARKSSLFLKGGVCSLTKGLLMDDPFCREMEPMEATKTESIDG